MPLDTTRQSVLIARSKRDWLLASDTQDVLTARHDPHFLAGGPSRDSDDARDIHAFSFEGLNQSLAREVLTDSSNQMHPAALRKPSS